MKAGTPAMMQSGVPHKIDTRVVARHRQFRSLLP